MAVNFEDSHRVESISGDPIDGEVANFAALPSAASVSGQVYRVLAEQGTWFLGTLKRAGDYYSDGASWTHLGSSSYIVKAYDTSTTDNAVVKYHSTDGQSIQESGVIIDDSDNVTGINNITTTGTTATLGNFVFNTDQTVGAGQDNYVLTYDNAGGEISLEASTGGLNDVVDDTTPQLGGDLDMNGNAISSPDGTHDLTITNTALKYTDGGVDRIDISGSYSRLIGTASTDYIEVDAGGATFVFGGTERLAADGTNSRLSSPDNTDQVRVANDNIELSVNAVAWMDVNASGVRMGLSNARVQTIYDEDNMASNSATALATQQSIKAYADTKIADVVDDATPQLGGQLDVNGNAIGDGTRELITFTEDGSAVNHVNIENEATGSGPIISAAGDDTNIDLNINAKGTGNVAIGNFTFDADQTVGAGQDNYVLTYDNAGGLISLEAAAGGGGETFPWHVGILDGTGGRYPAPIGTHGANTTVATADRIVFWPYFIANEQTYNRVGVEVTSAAAASTTARIGIYSNKTDDFAPGDLILDAGTVATDSTGVKEITISQTLQGLVWIAAICDSNPTMRRFSSIGRDIWLQTVGFEATDDTSESNVSLYKDSQSAEHTSLSDPAVTSLSKTTINMKAWVRKV